MTPTKRTIGPLVAVALSSTFLAGCSNVPVANKSGAAAHGHVQLRLEMPDAGDPEGEFFADAVARRSGGSIRLTIDPTGYSTGLTANELRLARALETGSADIGYLPARAWAAAGAGSFQALMAPFTVTTTATEQALSSGPVAEQVLSGLPDGVVGVGLVPAEPRRVLANRPPVSLRAFTGMRIRIIDNPQSATDFSALGATPVQEMTGRQVNAGLERHQLDATETSPTFALDNAYYHSARYLSAYAVLPKFQSIVLNRKTWRRLSDGERTALSQAAADTVARAGQTLPTREAQALEGLCGVDVMVAIPSGPELRALAHAAKGAERGITDDPVARRALEAIRGLPGAGPQPTASPVPKKCRERQSSRTDTTSTGPATVPEGTYSVTTTAADLRAGGLSGPKFDHALTETTTFHNGRWYQVETPSYPGQGPWGGPYTVNGDRITLRYLLPTVNDSPPDVLRWSYFDGALRFSVIDVTDPAARVMYAAHPWRKIR